MTVHENQVKEKEVLICGQLMNDCMQTIIICMQ